MNKDDVALVRSVNSKIIHSPGCPWIRRMKKEKPKIHTTRGGRIIKPANVAMQRRGRQFSSELKNNC